MKVLRLTKDEYKRLLSMARGIVDPNSDHAWISGAEYGINILDSPTLGRETDPIWESRLWSLWDMLDKYGYRIANLLIFFHNWEKLYGSSLALQRDDLDGLRTHVERMGVVCEELALESARVRAQFLIEALRIPAPLMVGASGWSGAYYSSQLWELERHLQTDLDGIYFESIPKDRLKYHDSTFGAQVAKAFPSANYDVREANICYALGRSTACVFHCMRAAEIALRALCRDRGIKFPPGHDLDRKQWGDLIKRLDSENVRLDNLPATTWKSPQMRDAQIAFYTDAVSIFRGLNERWRKPVSHARSRYDDIDAGSIRLRTEEFMTFLAGRISERKKTPEIWMSS